MPDRATVDFDHHAAEIARDPYPTYARMRGECPVAWSEAHGGFWAISRYDDVWAATQDDATFCSAPSIALPPPDYGIRNVPIDTDDPETQQFRKVLLGAYSPAQAKRLEPEVRALAVELLEAHRAAGRIDFVEDFSTPLPARIILRLLGFDEERYAFFTDRIHFITTSLATDPDGVSTAAMELAGEVWAAMEDRRTNGYRDDQLSIIMQAEVGGLPLADADVMSFTMLLFFGGLDTTTGSLANALILVDRDPALRRRLVDHPEDVPKAVEEVLRYWSPVQGLGRTLSRDVVVGGQQLRKGERALLMWASANRDPGRFPDADVVDLDRLDQRHLAFGVGLHRCLGSNLGRTMFRVMLEEVLARMPDFRLDGDPTDHRYDDCANVFSVRRLPATFTPS